MARRAISVAAQVADEALPGIVTRWRQSGVTAFPRIGPARRQKRGYGACLPCTSAGRRSLARLEASWKRQPPGPDPQRPADAAINAERSAGARDRSADVRPRALMVPSPST